MMREPLPPAAVVKPAVPATSELDLERWPRWIRDALAIQPEAKVTEHPSVESGPVRVDPASVRNLTRIPSRS